MMIQDVSKSEKREGSYSGAARHKHLIAKTKAHLKKALFYRDVKKVIQSHESSLFNHILDEWARA